MRQRRPRRIGRSIALLSALALLGGACTGEAVETTTSVTMVSTTTPARPTSTTTTNTSAPENPEAGKPYGGRVVVADTQEPSTLNPLVPGGRDQIVGMIGNGYLTGVQRVDGTTFELVPDVVVELPSVENGGFEVVVKEGDETNPFTGEVFEGVPDTDLVVRYEIDPDAVWEDGTPITGEDFLFTYQTIIDPDNPTIKPPYDLIVHPAAEPWCRVQLQAAAEATEDTVADAETEAQEPEIACLPAEEIEDTFRLIDDKTVEFTLWQPTIKAELMFAVLLPKHQVEGTDFANDWNDTPWYSAGPFKFAGWEKGDSIRLVRNERYWGIDGTTGQPLPFLDEVVFRFIGEPASLINAFAAREVEVVNPDPTSEALERLERLASEGAEMQVGAGHSWEHLAFSFSDQGRLERNADSLTTRPELRRAVAQGIDRQRIAEQILMGQIEPLSSYVDAFIPRISSAAWDRKYPYDPSAAATLLGELCDELRRDCDEDPITVVFTTTANIESRTALADLLAGFLKPLGVEFLIELEDSTLYYGDTTVNGRFDLGAWAWPVTPGLSGLVDIHNRWSPGGQPPGGDNYYFWGTPDGYQDDLTAEYGELLADLNSAIDTTEIEDLVARAEELLSDALVFIPLYAHLDVAATWADTVGGVVHNPKQGVTWNMGEWYLVGP